MNWILDNYKTLVNENGQVLKLIKGTWRHPEEVDVQVKQNISESEKQRLIINGLNHIGAHISELEVALLDRLDKRKRANLS